MSKKGDTIRNKKISFEKSWKSSPKKTAGQFSLFLRLAYEEEKINKEKLIPQISLLFFFFFKKKKNGLLLTTNPIAYALLV